MTAPAPDRFETIAYVYSQSDLALLMSVFESEDIWLVAVGRLHIAVDPGIATALGGVELRVHAEDAEDARRVLASLEPIPYRAPFFTGSFPIDLLFLVLMMVVFAVPPPPRMIPCFVGVAARREG
jgi:hypothetical protein